MRVLSKVTGPALPALLLSVPAGPRGDSKNVIVPTGKYDSARVKLAFKNALRQPLIARHSVTIRDRPLFMR